MTPQKQAMLTDRLNLVLEDAHEVEPVSQTTALEEEEQVLCQSDHQECCAFFLATIAFLGHLPANTPHKRQQTFHSQESPYKM